MTGLYGSTLADNNYTWPTDHNWYDSSSTDWGGNPTGTRTTFLDAFLPTSNNTTIDFYGFDSEGNRTVYFYKQNANGNGYTLANTVTISGTGFNLSDKYNGFKCVAWNSSNNTSNWNLVGDLMNQGGQYYYDAYPNQSEYQPAPVDNNSGLHIYFNRQAFALNFMDGAYFDGNDNPIAETSQGQFKTVSDIVQ